MAINVVTMTVPRKDRTGRTPFSLHFDSADLSGAEELLTMPSGATSIYLEKIVIATTAAITVTVGDGETSSAPTTDVIGPITMNRDVGTPANELAAVAIFSHEFIREILFSISIILDASGAGVVWGIAEGYYV